MIDDADNNNFITFSKCSFLLTITTVICWSINTRIVASRAGKKANRIDHHGLLPIGWTSQLLSLIVGEKLDGTCNFGVPTFSQTSTPVITTIATMTAKSARTPRTALEKKLDVRNCFKPVTMANVPTNRRTLASHTFGT